MNFKDHIKFWNKMQNNFSNTLTAYENIQNKAALYNAQYMNVQNRLMEISNPILNFQSQMNQIVESFNFAWKHYESISKYMNSNMQHIFQEQYRITEYLSSVDSSLLSSTITDTNSIRFSQIFLDTINEFNFDDFPEDIHETAETTLELSQQSNKLTWEQIIIIITFIMNLILFTQAQLPKENTSQSFKIQNSLNKLIDIETKELDLLKQTFK